MKTNSLSQVMCNQYFPKQKQANAKKKEIRDLLSGKSQREEFGGNRILQDNLNYSQTLRENRAKTKGTDLALKKLKYSFKSISAQILRSKTSASAKQAAGAARREVQRLKSQRQSGKYDEEELDAAIAHAKAMERVAKKKAAHLLEEELAKVTGGNCLGDEEDKTTEIEEVDSTQKDTMSEKDSAKEEFDDFIHALEEDMYEDSQGNRRELQEMMQSMMEELSVDMSDDAVSNMLLEFNEDMLENLSEDLLEEMGFDELLDSLMAVEKEMDPKDFKMLKIKHRNEEMKAITKADTEYLKAMFEHYEKQMGNSSAQSMAVTQPVAMTQPMTTSVEIQLPDLSGVIDILL